MDKENIYKDIAERTNQSIYIGVVGPVRTGKSTFIKRFMETLVIPNIENQYHRERAIDELPQSASGRTIMTTEPKFIPEEAAEVKLIENTSFKVRMIDCVGYIVDEAIGYDEDGQQRMVNTPWFKEPVPFNVAAEIGTKKVITEHSTIGLLVTTDGSIGDIDRKSYELAESRVVAELKEINKPFVILLNSSTPTAKDTQLLKQQLEEKYLVPVVCMDCLDLKEEDVKNIISKVLFEFPIREVGIFLPDWVGALDDDHWLKQDIYSIIKESLGGLKKINQLKESAKKLVLSENILSSNISNIDLGTGTTTLELTVDKTLFYKILSDQSGLLIDNDQTLVTIIRELSIVKKEYDKISYAMNEVKNKGYGIVSPTVDEMTLEEPKIVKHGGKFGIKLKASAPSIHIERNKQMFGNDKGRKQVA